MKKIFTLITLFLLFVSPIISQTKEDKKAAKEALAIKEYAMARREATAAQARPVVTAHRAATDRPAARVDCLVG